MSALRIFVFVGAFLLFAMEPMVARMLLPHFGGGFHVWTTSLMFFQGALFLGYLYAHLAAARVGRWHLLAIAVPVVLLPPTVRFAGGAGSAGGIGSLLAELTLDFALPFAALATTGVVAQAWLARSTLPERTAPYVLYAVSNAGSLLALVAYALVIEPLLGLGTQRAVWAVLYALYLIAAIAAYRATHRRALASPSVASPTAGPTSAGDGAAAPVAPVGAGMIVYWIALAAFPSIFLMAVTNLIALDAGNVPLVWIAPLALYLLTFVVAFSEPSRVPSFVRRLWPHFGAVGLFFFAGGEAGGPWAQVILHLSVLTIICLAAHGELYAQRPATAHLTLYYLVISLGGWIGGAFVALGAPTFFPGLFEYPLAIVGLMIAMGLAHRRALVEFFRGPGRAALVMTVLLIAAIGWRVASGSGGGARSGAVRTLEIRRSFYGIYYVIERPSSRGVERDLVSGSTRHGRQFLSPEHRREPLSYYPRSGPLGDAMEIVAARGAPRRIGVVGLGVGAAAGYVEAGESIDFFEIDPAVVELARTHFTYLSDCPGEVRTIVGDARLTLARQDPSIRYDLLLIDAFSGDAIPTHLVTREAVELYRTRLTEHGVLLFHVSNRYFALAPVLAAIARELGLAAGREQNLSPADREAADPAHYFVMLEHPEDLAPFAERGFVAVTETVPRPTDPWTDDHVNTLQALMAD
jgi:hypothetical protein